MSEECKQAVVILYTLNLWQHTLSLMSDQSIGVVDCSGSIPSSESGMYLSGEETYRLFISLWEVFKGSKKDQ